MIRNCSPRAAIALVGAIAVLSAGACQNPNEPTDTIDYSEALEITVDPDPIVADGATGGKLYRVVRGNNQPDEMLPYDWHAVFSSTLLLNTNANSEDLDLDFPVRITGATLAVKQATGGIITPPSGGETEKFEYCTARRERQSVWGDQQSDLPDLRSLVRPSEPPEGIRHDADLRVCRQRRHQLPTRCRLQSSAVGKGMFSQPLQPVSARRARRSPGGRDCPGADRSARASGPSRCRAACLSK